MLKDTVLKPECKPFNKTHGLNLFELASKDPGLNRSFNEVLSSNSKVLFDKIVSVHPHIHALNFDLPHVIADAPKYPDVEHVAGDMFELLPNAQNILLKNVLHDWDDVHCMKLLRNCWKALPNNGKVIVVEFAIPQQQGNHTDSLDAIALDFFMLVYLPGGKERTTAEFDDLAKAAGFAETKFFPIAQGIYVMEFIKRSMD
ncbi:hypothetical protein L1049_009528 [Liquidambar formosana]|uniref:O-methyltransferase C-terminal domain-containing protein n=1 Tax=Liquidambar formosana TaxID=63359 RepID=A0AAP0N9P7_LIQFO